MNQARFVGIDIAKDKFDAAKWLNHGYQTREFSNTKQGFQTFVEWVKKDVESPWFCMESTGNYGRPLADYLHTNGYQVSEINPLQIKRFAQSKLKRNKTDALDAKVIAEYGTANEPREYEPKKESQREITELMNLLNSLKNELVRLKNQLSSAQGKVSKKMLTNAIERLKKESNAVEKELANQTQEDKDLQQQEALLSSIPCVGKLTIYTLLGRIVDIRQFENAKQFAAYLGVTPYQRQSGKYVGKTTMSRMGDASIRKILYMAALVGMRYNPILKEFAERLKAKGKASKAIIGALMRKLAHIIYGVLKNETPFTVGPATI